MINRIITQVFLFILLFCGLEKVVFSLPLSPRIKNFGTSDYMGGNQNWSLTQDSKGFVYVANNKGLLIYNGNSWERIQLPLHFPIRSVFVSSKDVVYLGSYEEFGYLQKVDGKFEYKSLKEKVIDFEFNTDEIWNIVEYDKKIFFQSFSSIFIYDNDKIRVISGERHYLNLIKVDSYLYSQAIGGGFFVYHNGNFVELFNRSSINDDIVGVEPYSKDDLLLASKNNGLYIFNKNTRFLNKFFTEVDEELKRHSVNRTSMSHDSVFVFGTLSRGLYAINKEGKLLWEINTDNKLINNTVLCLYCDSQNNFWLALDNGVAKVYNNSAILYYESRMPSIGMVYDFLQEGSTSYFATNHGLYYYRDNCGVQCILTEQTWGIEKFENQIVCCHNKGSFLIEGTQAKILSTTMGGMSIKELSLNNEDILLQSTYGNFIVYKKLNNRWKEYCMVENSPRLIKSFEKDYLNNIWAKKMYGNVVRFTISNDFTRELDHREYNILKPRNGYSINVMAIGKRVIFTDENKFYTYDDLKDSIVPYEILNTQLPNLLNTYKIVKINENNFWFISPNFYTWVREEDGTYYIVQQIETQAPNAPVEEEGNAIIDEVNNCSYLLLNGGVICYRHNYIPTPISPRLYISKLNFRDRHNRDFVIDTSETRTMKVKYNYNNFRINLANPIYNESDYKTIVCLDGLEGNYENVSDFEYEYLRLPYGDYTFKAKVVDYKGNIVDELSFSFVIQRPYYLSGFAIFFYLILVGLIFYLGVQYLNRRKSRLIERQKQQYHLTIKEKENQLIALQKQQLEEEVRLKSKELSTSAMANIANIELLTMVQEELIQHKKHGISKDDIQKILKRIEGNLKTNTDDWNLFQENFDRVHENFFNRLKDEFPQLTSTDLRLCAFLRLNLTTKDISRLMNISLRGVEAGRYRLRKKFNIGSDQSLTDFVMQFKDN